ncbi:MAG: universal stress protein [Planctomycetota bacterium]
MSNSSELDRDVDDAMRLFERSRVGNTEALTPIRPSRVLLVLDGSDQDETSTRSAEVLRERFDTETLVIDARQDAQGDLAVEQAKRVNGARPLARRSGDSFDVILDTIHDHQIDLLVVPSPFGRSFEKVGTDSVGTVMDVLLARCPVPILVTRRSDQTLAVCCQRISLLVGGECDVEARAAAWTFGLAADAAEISLNLVVEREHFENVRSILESLRPEETFDTQTLSNALAKTHQSLHAAMTKTATAQGCRYHLMPQAGEVAPPNPLSDPQQQMLVLPLEVDDRFGQGFVSDRLRRSPHPVLIVPGHVPAS